jgi:hypothetical protein
MAQLDLTEQEVEALIVLLEGNLTDLSMEIADTDRKTFRDELKARRDELHNILQKLKKSTN